MMRLSRGVALKVAYNHRERRMLRPTYDVSREE